MKVILKFLKPHRGLCAAVLLLAVIDVVGALIIPTYAAAMLNEGTAGADFSVLISTCIKMLIAALISGAVMIAASFLCADLTSKVGADMRNALYKKTLSLSVADFRSFGTASVTTRTVSDITNIQVALGNCFQMLFPVPFIFVVSVTLAFRLDRIMGSKVDYFIRTMPQGYDTMLDNESGNLSVGQRQLITIARVFLCDPPVIILDEATSSVDTRTEVEIGKAMKKLMRGRTSFVIAHRLSTIRDADTILFMEQGNIIEQGNHEELLKKGGAYTALYNSQFE